MVLTGIGAETDETAAKQLPVYVQLSIEQFAAPGEARRPAGDVGGRPARLVEAAAPGSDHQLTFVKAFAGSSGKRNPPSSYGGAARSEAGLDFLEGLLDGSTTPDGLTVGNDIRWAALTALAAHGRADEARLLEELERDNTISGQERAAGALAVMPTAEAKAKAWHDAVVSDDLSNETQRSICYVFDCSGQQELLAPYLEKYLEAADTIWEAKGTQVATTVLEFMFPRALTSQETLDRVESWLETSPANPAAKRYVAEGRDDIVRALRAQAAAG